jgi:ribosomal protein S12 methylthiotransferase
VSYRVAFISLGCPKNQVDCELMLSRTLAAGFEITRRLENADAIVINTCSFIAPAIAEANEQIQQARRYRERGRCQALVVAGCLPQYLQDRRFSEYPYVDAWLTPDNPGAAGEVLSRLLAPATDEAANERAELEPSENKLHPLPLPRFLSSAADGRVLSTPPSYAYVKIAEGCDHRCSFCIIPRLRGRYRSRPPADVVQEVQGLVRQGIPEIILVSQDCSYYGRDCGGPGLMALLDSLCAIDGDFWLRVLYLYPGAMSTTDIRAWSALGPKLLPYFDIPLQHISPAQLRAMGRADELSSFESALSCIRQYCPRAIVRTSFIAGFPGETMADFELLLHWARSGAVDRAGVFAYSDLPEMASHNLADHVAPAEAERRRTALMQALVLSQETKARGCIGSADMVIAESRRRNPATRLWEYAGRGWRDAPEIDGVTLFSTPKDLPLYKRYPVQVTGVRGVDMLAALAAK